MRLPTGNVHLGFENATTEGAATLVFRYWGVVDGKFVEDEAKQNLTAIPPPMMVDYDRDGDIDARDSEAAWGNRYRAKDLLGNWQPDNLVATIRFSDKRSEEV